MGMDCSAGDMANVMAFTKRMVALATYRADLSKYLGEKMQAVAPNLSTLVGDSVGARLIAKAGSLASLAKCPASTVQILGAEKALFRALKKKGNTPKYGPYLRVPLFRGAFTWCERFVSWNDGAGCFFVRFRANSGRVGAGCREYW